VACVSSAAAGASSQAARTGAAQRRQFSHRQRTRPKEITMNRTSIATRMQSLAAAAAVTLAMLAGIDTLAVSESSNALLVQTSAASQSA
jgi:hypothetical protein